MLFRFARQIDGKLVVSGKNAHEDLTDWKRFEEMDDDDIVYDEDSPPLPDDFGSRGVFRKGERPATKEEIAEFLEKVKAYADRPRKPPAK
jgi:hypothetical protein